MLQLPVCCELSTKSQLQVQALPLWLHWAMRKEIHTYKQTYIHILGVWEYFNFTYWQIWRQDSRNTCSLMGLGVREGSLEGVEGQPEACLDSALKKATGCHCLLVCHQHGEVSWDHMVEEGLAEAKGWFQTVRNEETKDAVIPLSCTARASRMASQPNGGHKLDTVPFYILRSCYNLYLHACIWLYTVRLASVFPS